MIHPATQAQTWVNQMMADPIAAAKIKNHIALEELIALLELPVTPNDSVEEIICGFKEIDPHETK